MVRSRNKSNFEDENNDDFLNHIRAVDTYRNTIAPECVLTPKEKA